MCAPACSSLSEYAKFIQFNKLRLVSRESSALMTFFACFSHLLAVRSSQFTNIFAVWIAHIHTHTHINLRGGNESYTPSHTKSHYIKASAFNYTFMRISIIMSTACGQNNKKFARVVEKCCNVRLAAPMEAPNIQIRNIFLLYQRVPDHGATIEQEQHHIKIRFLSYRLPLMRQHPIQNTIKIVNIWHDLELIYFLRTLSSSTVWCLFY